MIQMNSGQPGPSQGYGPSENDQNARRDREVAMKFVKERVIDYDARDAEVWRLITDVPFLSTPWQYICFILNVIIPGKDKIINEISFFRDWNDALLRLLRKMVKDTLHGRPIPALTCLYLDRLAVFYLLGMAHHPQELAR